LSGVWSIPAWTKTPLKDIRGRWEELWMDFVKWTIDEYDDVEMIPIPSDMAD
jgi:hypothetical protein